MLDGNKAYVQGIIDNCSRRILAIRVSPKLEPAATAALLLKAVDFTDEPKTAASVMVDSGVENFNHAVNRLVDEGVLRRIVAQTDLRFSNSMIEMFWRGLKQHWCFLHRLDSIQTLRRLVTFYVEQHNAHVPHAAFEGQTPDEMYFGTGEHVPSLLEQARALARQARLAANRTIRCEACLVPSCGA